MTLAQRNWLLLKLIPYPIIFMLGGLIYGTVEYGLIGGTGRYPSTGNVYNATASLMAIAVMSPLFGILLGLIEELWFKSKLRDFPFFPKMVLKSLVYVFVLVAILLASTFVVNALVIGEPIAGLEVRRTVEAFMGSLVYIGFIIDISLFFSEIVDYLGLDVVGSYFTGKYSRPVVEERVFMFLDMKGSTAIAERLGHTVYYELINDYYGDMTRAILETKGQIYQYVGDEIVISWKLEKGLENAHCIHCFFLIKEIITERNKYYEKKYGLMPEFKAGAHLGEVTRGQVGLIKREMLFTGDVLNTSARIQGLCNDLQAELLVSGSLKNALGKTVYTVREQRTTRTKG
jgi:class 3 adenylate cyclase